MVAQNTAVLDTYWGIGDSIGRYSGILIPGIGGIDRKTEKFAEDKQTAVSAALGWQKKLLC